MLHSFIKNQKKMMLVLAVVFLAAVIVCVVLFSPVRRVLADKTAVFDVGAIEVETTAYSVPAPVLTLTGHTLSWTTAGDTWFVIYINVAYPYYTSVEIFIPDWGWENYSVYNYTGIGWAGNSITLETLYEYCSGGFNVGYVSLPGVFAGPYLPRWYPWQSPGINSVRVAAIDPDTGTILSDDSNEIDIVVPALPEPVLIVTPTGLFWDIVPDVTSYEYRYSGGAFQSLGLTRYVEFDLSSLPVSVSSSLHIDVRSVGDNIYWGPSAFTRFSYRIMRLNNPVLTRTGNLLSWSAVPFALSYTVSYNDNDSLVSFVTTSTVLDLEAVGLADIPYALSVRGNLSGFEVAAFGSYSYWVVQEVSLLIFADSELEPIYFSYDEVTEVPDPPPRFGYRFLGWFIDSDFEYEYTPNFLGLDTIVYAGWEARLSTGGDDTGGDDTGGGSSGGSGDGELADVVDLLGGSEFLTKAAQVVVVLVILFLLFNFIGLLRSHKKRRRL
jgi:hypothetical protein